MTEQLEFDLMYLAMARSIAQESKDPSTKMGAVILTRDDRRFFGYNSFPLSMKQDTELYADRKLKYSRMVHGEVRALNKVTCSVEGATLYTWPFLPCDRCFVQMLDAGIVRFVAPNATEDQLSRWAKAFDLVRSYAQEAGVELVEIEF